MAARIEKEAGANKLRAITHVIRQQIHWNGCQGICDDDVMLPLSDYLRVDDNAEEHSEDHREGYDCSVCVEPRCLDLKLLFVNVLHA